MERSGMLRERRRLMENEKIKYICSRKISLETQNELFQHETKPYSTTRRPDGKLPQAGIKKH
jgi:hypothetical protein